MNDDGDPMRGILIAAVIATPIWLAVWWLTRRMTR